MRCLPGRIVWLGAWLGSLPVAAEIFRLDHVAVPEPNSLKGLYVFYVFAAADSPVKTNETASVEFRGVWGSADGQPSEADAQSVQVSVMPYREIPHRIDEKHFCVQAGTRWELDVMTHHHETLAGLNIYMETVPFPSATSVSNHITVPHVLDRTAAYLLVLSNCGHIRNGTLWGEIHVRNPHGYLPGNEFHKMPFYGGQAALYAVLALGWSVLSLYRRKVLFMLHWCIFAVILLSFAEAFILWWMLYDWNTTGVQSQLLLPLSLLVSSTKSVFSYMLVLVASMGWGVTMAEIPGSAFARVQCCTASYLILDFVRGVMLAYRFRYSFRMGLVLLCLLPVAMLNLCIFLWIFRSLAAMIRTLRDQSQVEKLRVFEKFLTVLMVSLAIASIAVVFQLIVLPLGGLSMRWHYQWFFGDGVMHVLYLFVLLCIMYLWMPSEHSDKYVYCEQIVDEDEDKGMTVGPLDDLQPEAPAEAFEIGDLDELDGLEVGDGAHSVRPHRIGASMEQI